MKHVACRSSGIEIRDDARTVTRALLNAAAGAIATVDVLASDMADLKETIRRHDQSEARARAILDGAPEAIITTDSHGAIETANRTAEKLFGYTAAEMPGRDVELLISIDDGHRDRGCFQLDVASRLRSMRGIVRAAIGHRKDGTSLPVTVSLSEIDFNGRRLTTMIVRPREPR